MRTGDVHLEGSNLRFFYFVLISFLPKAYISHFFPPKMISICFIFPLMNTQYFKA